MDKITSFMKDNKKYVAATFAAGFAFATTLGYAVPAWVPLVLAGFGIQVQ